MRVITLNRPHRKNAFDGAWTRAFDQALTGLDEDPELWVGIVYGGTEVFSAGADLKAVMSGDIPVLDGKGFGGFAKRTHAKPLIAAVEGPALGAARSSHSSATSWSPPRTRSSGCRRSSAASSPVAAGCCASDRPFPRRRPWRSPCWASRSRRIARSSWV